MVQRDFYDIHYTVRYTICVYENLCIVILTFFCSEAVKNLGPEKFEAVYNCLKKTRFDDRRSGKEVDEKRVMRDLNRICSNSDLCVIVEQLLFLEMSDRS